MSLDRDVATLLAGAPDARVLCLGDLMLDRFWSGESERVSPEAPIPVIEVKHERAMPGGVGNVARNLAALGARIEVIALVGADTAGAEVRAQLAAMDGIADSTIADPPRATTVKARILARGQQMLRVDWETVAPPGPEAEAALIAAIDAAVARCDIIAVSDYAKGVCAPAILRHLFRAARARQVPVVVDPKGTDFARYDGATLLTPNLKELAQASGMSVDDEDRIVAAARRLRRRDGLARLLITRGASGMSLIGPDDEAPVHLPAQAREVYEVSGAGDTVLALLALGMACGLAPERAAAAANLAAGLVVEKVGTAVVHPSELRQAALDRQAAATGGKVMALDPALDRIARWRADGARIAFTNGCFDLIHPGHLSLLDQARAAADRLVVGLNDDASVARLKGENRPIQPADARAAVLAALGAVDLVIVFAEDTPLELIEAIRPEVLVKGADYARDQVVGADIVERHGGRVLLAELVDGLSTSRTIAKIAG